ncbi:MAG: RNA methyltransferase [Zetaproteobacteria bacterium]|nr:RNA methyltransferase [Zetaproteobacteria bacterium]
MNSKSPPYVSIKAAKSALAKERRSRKPGRKESTRPWYDGVHSFDIDSKSALREYIRYRPHLVKEIRCSPKELSTWENILVRESPELLPSLSEDVGLSSLLARVGLRALSEADFFDHLNVESKDGVLVMDHLEDPRNVGAIARTAAFFGIKWIVLPKARQSGIVQATVATAQGAFALCDFVAVANLARFCEKLKTRGYWILGADMVGTSVNESESRGLDLKALVLGNEQKGLSNLVRRNCDMMVSVPSAGSEHLESLNVSVAGGILMHQIFAR